MEEQIDELVRDIDSNDPVYRATCLHLIADLACSKDALPLLEQRQIPQKLIAILNESDPLIVPHALKLFYRINPLDLESKYPEVLRKIFDYCQSEDKQLLDYAIDFVAALGRGGFLARKVLDRSPEFRPKCLTKIGETIVCSESLLKSRALRCIADLLEIHEDDPREEVSALGDDFYHSIMGDKTTERILSLCRVPFPEIKVAAMSIVAIIADQTWGQKELAARSDFVDWILNRASESGKDCKEAKFEILKTLVKSKTSCSIFGSDNYLKMRTDFKNGPFHVAMEEMCDSKIS